MKSKLLSGLGLFAGLCLMLGSCIGDEGKTPYQRWLEDIADIDAYLAANPPTDPTDIIVKDASGIRLVITERPAGDIDGTEPVPLPPTPENIIRVGYEGRILSKGQLGTIPFDADDSYIFTLTTSDASGSDVIDGWKTALSMMTEGMKATVYIPSLLAYGTRGSGSIGANEILVFDLNLKEVDTSNEQPKLAQDKGVISAYLESEEDVVEHPNNFSYILEPIGTGPRPDMYDQVTIKYTGSVLKDGEESVFAQDILQGPVNVFSSMPANYIHGLNLGLQLMHEGDKAKFYFPSALGYGPSTQPGIAANSILVFDVELVEVIPNQ